MKDAKSFRRNTRKIIEDSKAERNQRAADEQQNASLNNIHERLGDVQTATEMNGESARSKSNEILEGLAHLGRVSQDTGAAAELTAEGVEASNTELRKLNDTALQISEKLAQLSTLLENKVNVQSTGQGQTSTAAANSSSTSLAVISEAIPDIEQSNEDLRATIERLLPDVSRSEPDADFLPEDRQPLVPPPTPDAPPAQVVNDSKDDKGKNKSGQSISDKLDELIKTTKGGFKSSVGFADKISNMLFKYTVTAAAAAAKTAAMILSIVLAIDVIRIHFDYWSKLFETNFTEFNAKAKEWAPLLEAIITSVNEVREAWEKGDFSGLALAIVKGIGSVIKELGELIVLGLSKAVAGLFRSMGMEDKALDVEGDALQTYQEHTGAKLSEENANTLAKYQAKQYDRKQELADSTLGNSAAAKLVLLGQNGTRDDYDKIQAGHVTPVSGLNETDKLSAIKASNEASAAMTRFNKYVEDADPSKASSKSNIEKAYNEIKNDLNDPALNKAPDLKAMLEKKLSDIDAKYNTFKSSGAQVKPDDISENPDTKSVQRIAQNSNANTGGSQAQTGNNIQVNNVSKTSRTQINTPPQSSSPAPGMSNHAFGVN